MAWPEIIGLITGAVTIAGALVGVTRYISQLQFQVRLERLEAEKEQAEKTRSDLTATNKLLLDDLTAARRGGAAASAKKAEIEEALSSLMKLTQARAGSVYVPLMNETDRNPLGLVYVSILPIAEQTMKLRKKIIPLQSLAGRCFRTGNAFTVANSQSSSDHYVQADTVSGYKTQDTLNVPLRAQGQIVGVLQLLNKREAPFTESEIPRVEQLSSPLAFKIDEFLRTPGNLEVLGFVPNRDTEDATVMFCDLTASSTLFQELNVSAAIQHINDYLECICNVAFAYGATVDKYMGDGVLLRFNVPHPIENHPIAAIKSALEIQSAFELVKKDWIIMGELLSGIYTRTGIAYGPVQRAVVGHPQYQYLTIFGTPVNAAINLCDILPRDRNAIVIDEMLYQHLGDTIEVKEIPGTNLGKAQRYTVRAYEVQGLRQTV
jgi:class 3 adenylate cyclase